MNTETPSTTQTDNEGWTIPEVAVTVDLAVLTIRADALQIMLVRRGIPPFRGKYALPGGFLASTAEDTDDAAMRELTEETGLDPAGLHLEQLRTYGAPRRDPRRRVITVCYLAFVPHLPAPTPGGDVTHAEWFPVETILGGELRLAFDHNQIVDDAVERARSKLEYTTLGSTFCPPEFTVTDLRRVYETVWGQRIDARNFHRKVTGIPGFLIPTGAQSRQHGGRPAAMYRRGSAELLHPAMLRAESPAR